MSEGVDLYGGAGPVDAPAYTVGMVAQFLDVPEATVRYWAYGRDHHRPVIKVADAAGRRLSFRNLTEVHILDAIRRKYGVRLPAVRRAVLYLREKFASEHPLSDLQMTTDGLGLFVTKFGALINASRAGQLAIEGALKSYLQRIERDSGGDVVRLFPFTRSPGAGPRIVVIDPRVQFGRPCIFGSGIPTEEVRGRFKAGEPVAALAEDFGRSLEEIEEAIRYETPDRRAA